MPFRGIGLTAALAGDMSVILTFAVAVRHLDSANRLRHNAGLRSRL
jgi:hypothetical protein